VQTENAGINSNPEINLAVWVRRLMRHPLYDALRDEPSLHRFMRSNVFAVWRLPIRLKALQHSVTCVEVPW
jgi:hypothetical protein